MAPQTVHDQGRVLTDVAVVIADGGECVSDIAAPSTRLRCVNIDRIASQRWPGDELAHGYDAAQLAAQARQQLIGERRSFVTETVVSHPSKLDLLTAATEAGYLITLHIVMIPADLAVIRVRERVARGGHHVPEAKIVERWHRLWTHLAAAAPIAEEVVVYDNSGATHPSGSSHTCAAGARFAHPTGHRHR